MTFESDFFSPTETGFYTLVEHYRLCSSAKQMHTNVSPAREDTVGVSVTFLDGQEAFTIQAKIRQPVILHKLPTFKHHKYAYYVVHVEGECEYKPHGGCYFVPTDNRPAELLVVLHEMNYDDIIQSRIWSSNWDALKYASKDVTREVLENMPSAYEYIREELRADIELAVLAISTDCRMLKTAPDEIRLDPELVAMFEKIDYRAPGWSLAQKHKSPVRKSARVSYIAGALLCLCSLVLVLSRAGALLYPEH
jgi:hypothetical protein